MKLETPNRIRPLTEAQRFLLWVRTLEQFNQKAANCTTSEKPYHSRIRASTITVGIPGNCIVIFMPQSACPYITGHRRMRSESAQFAYGIPLSVTKETL